MSSDYLNFAVLLPESEALACQAALTPKQHTPDLVGPDEQRIARVTPGAPLDLAGVATAYAGRAPAPAHYGRAFVDVDPEPWLQRFEDAARSLHCHVTLHEPGLALIDRVLAVPHGVALLQGQALACYEAKDQRRLRLSWAILMKRIGGMAGATSWLAPHVRDQVAWASVRDTLTMLVDVLSADSDGDGDGDDHLVLLVTRT